jgi:hypothetical protein
MFNYDDGSRFHVVEYFARSSFASAFAEPFDAGNAPSKLSSAFQRRIVSADLDKSLGAALVSRTYDVILIDLIDERFNLLIDGPRVATISNELVATGILERSDPQWRACQSGSDQHRQLWMLGWARFRAVLAQIHPAPRLVLHKVRWATRTGNGNDLGPRFPAELIARNNEYLADLQSALVEDLPDIGVIELPDALYLAADEHRWGLSPFHYVTEHYRVALDQLWAIVQADNTRASEFRRACG